MSDAEIRALADRQAITDQIYRYCRAMDRMDPALGYSVFHDDAWADYGADVYQGTGRGFVDFACDQHRRALVHHHQVTNVLIELDGERAASEAYVFSDLRVGQAEQVRQITTWGRYLDRWSRRGGRWAIDERISIRDFSEIRQVTPMPIAERGRRAPTDPSYAVLRGPR